MPDTTRRPSATGRACSASSAGRCAPWPKAGASASEPSRRSTNQPRQFYVSAYQSYLFNRVVAARIEDGLGRLVPGDLAWIHQNGAVFEVTDPAAEQERADRLEISPTGPLFGYRMTQAGGKPGELEAGVLAAEGLTADDFHRERLRVKGGRRPLRFKIADPGIRLGADSAGAYLELRFALPRGCYATLVLNELFVDTEPGDAVNEDGGAEMPADL